MAQVCILTDSTALFANPAFQGHDCVSVLPIPVIWKGDLYTVGQRELKVTNLPPTARNGSHPRLEAPSSAEIRRVLLSIGQRYSAIVVILVSSQLCPVFDQALPAVEGLKGSMALHLVDSQTTGGSLGLLVQAAAQAAARGASFEEIKVLVNTLIPRLYSIFCVQGLTYLSHLGQIDPAQALVGEMLGLQPLLLLENGRLAPQYKVQSTHQLVEFLTEFLGEFESIKHIAIAQGPGVFLKEVRILKNRILSTYPKVPLTELSLNSSVSTLIGPRSLALSILSG